MKEKGGEKQTSSKLDTRVSAVVDPDIIICEKKTENRITDMVPHSNN